MTPSFKKNNKREREGLVGYIIGDFYYKKGT